MAVLGSTVISGDLGVTGVMSGSITVLTVAPTSANTDGGYKIVVLSSEPSTKYAGYIYLITSA